MDTRAEQLRKLGKAAERFRYLAACKMARHIHPGGIIVQTNEDVNHFLLAEGIGLAGGDGLLLVEEIQRLRSTLAAMVNGAPGVTEEAIGLLEGTHEHIGIIKTFGLPGA